MRRILPLLLLLPSLSYAAEDLSVRYAEAAKSARTIGRRLGPIVSSIKVGICYERPDILRAAELGLPKRFCIDRLNLRVRSKRALPWLDGFTVQMEGETGDKRMHTSGGAKKEWGWRIIGSLFTERGEQACGGLNSAHATVHASVDHDGRLLDHPVEVDAFLLDGGPRCENHRPTVRVPYFKAGEAPAEDDPCPGFDRYVGCVRAGDCLNSCPTRRRACWVDDAPRCAASPPMARTACWCGD